MDCDAFSTVPAGAAAARPVRLRISSVVVGLALILAAWSWCTSCRRLPGHALSPAGRRGRRRRPGLDSVHGQFDIRGFCAILLQVRNALLARRSSASCPRSLTRSSPPLLPPSGANPAPATGFPFGGFGV